MTHLRLGPKWINQLESLGVALVKWYPSHFAIGTEMSTEDIEATPLYLAAAKGHVEVVKILCNSNADVNKTPTCTSATPLYMACLNGHVKVVLSLCLARADLNKEVLRNQQTPLFVAAKNGNLEIAQVLGAASADLHKASAAKVTPLHMAAMGGHQALVQVLVSHKLCFRTFSYLFYPFLFNNLF